MRHSEELQELRHSPHPVRYNGRAPKAIIALREIRIPMLLAKVRSALQHRKADASYGKPGVDALNKQGFRFMTPHAAGRQVTRSGEQALGLMVVRDHTPASQTDPQADKFNNFTETAYVVGASQGRLLIRRADLTRNLYELRLGARGQTETVAVADIKQWLQRKHANRLVAFQMIPTASVHTATATPTPRSAPSDAPRPTPTSPLRIKLS
jgi:hypothetical protein